MHECHKADNTDVDKADSVASLRERNKVSEQHQQVAEHDRYNLVKNFHFYSEARLKWPGPKDENVGKSCEEELSSDLAPE